MYRLALICILGVLSSHSVAWAQGDGRGLPFPQTPMDSIVKPRLQDSTMKWPAEPQRLPDDAPNVLIVMLDDVGFGVSEVFGGEVKTPTFQKIADNGIR